MLMVLLDWSRVSASRILWLASSSILPWTNAASRASSSSPPAWCENSRITSPTGVSCDENASTWDTENEWWMKDQLKLGSSRPTEWSMWYNDQDKDLPIAGDAAELSEQLAAIGEYSDRSRVQQDFLRQKATARYWMDQISRFGGAQDLAENLFNNRDNQLRWSSPRLATGDTIDSSFDRPVPWANAGEGPLPDLTNMDMQLDECGRID